MEALRLRLLPPLARFDGSAYQCQALIRRGLDKTEEVTLRLTRQDYLDISTGAPEGKTPWDLTWIRTVDRNKSTWTPIAEAL